MPTDPISRLLNGATRTPDDQFVDALGAQLQAALAAQPADDPDTDVVPLTPERPVRRRRRVLALLATAAVVATSVGWLATTSNKPADLAIADLSSPAPTIAASPRCPAVGNGLEGLAPIEGRGEQLVPEGEIASIQSCYYLTTTSELEATGAAFAGIDAQEMARRLNELPRLENAACLQPGFERFAVLFVRYADGRTLPLAQPGICGALDNGLFVSRADASLGALLRPPTASMPCLAEVSLDLPETGEDRQQRLLPDGEVDSIRACFYINPAGSFAAQGTALEGVAAQEMAATLNRLPVAVEGPCNLEGQARMVVLFVTYADGQVVSLFHDPGCFGGITNGVFRAEVEASVASLLAAPLVVSCPVLASGGAKESATVEGRDSVLIPAGTVVSMQTCFYASDSDMLAATGAALHGSAAQDMATTLNGLTPPEPTRACPQPIIRRYPVVFVRYADGRSVLLTLNANCGTLNNGSFTASFDQSVASLFYPACPSVGGGCAEGLAPAQ